MYITASGLIEVVELSVLVIKFRILILASLKKLSYKV